MNNQEYKVNRKIKSLLDIKILNWMKLNTLETIPMNKLKEVIMYPKWRTII